jgi:hypothetical protein
VALASGVALVLGIGAALGATQDALIGATADGTAQGSTFGATVTCPAGQRVLSGGILQAGAPDDFTLRASGPLDETGAIGPTRSGDKPRKWYAAASNSTGSVSLRVFAVCAKARVLLEVKRLTIPVGETRGTSVACPGSRRAVGGGILSTGGGFVRETGPTDASGSFRKTRDGDAPKRWSAAMQNQGGGTVFKALVVCASRSQAKLRVTKAKVGAMQTGQTSASCGGSKRVLGGGVLHDKPPNNALFGVIPTGPLDSSGLPFATNVGDVPAQWYGGLKSIFSAEATFKVLAICE